MESPLLSSSRVLSSTQKATLARGGSQATIQGRCCICLHLVSANIKTISDVVLIAPFELAKRCRLSPSEAQNMINTVCKEFYRAPQTLDDPSIRRDEVFSTGDKYLDDALGGGVRSGKVWEVVGERLVSFSSLATPPSQDLFRQCSRKKPTRIPSFTLRPTPS